MYKLIIRYSEKCKAYLFLAVFSSLLVSCQEEWLDAKPSKALIVPETVADYQAILDNTYIFNQDYAELGEVSADNYYVTVANWNSAGTQVERNCYIWGTDIYGGETTNFDWTNGFKRILYANIALEGIEKIAPGSQETELWRNVKGSALFYRATTYYNLAQLFCKPFNDSSADSDLGLPLHLTPEVDKYPQRSSLRETYDRILEDLLLAAELLPENQMYKTRPSKNAANAFLSRVYLSIENYDKAYDFSDIYLKSDDALIDYNTLNTSAAYPLSLFNEEVVFHSISTNYLINFLNRFNVDTTLYGSYDNNDIRKTAFFRLSGSDIKFKGSYSGTYSFFSGISTNEMYLTRAECSARRGNVQNAADDLDKLMSNRFRNGTYVGISYGNAEELLKIILDERRKELVFTCQRWSDLRRLNRDSRFAKTLIRYLDGKEYSLAPNDIRYTLPIPPEEIRLSGIQQNERN